MNSYKGITFAEGYNKPFAEFKKEFGSTYVFKKIHPDQREKELKEAYKIATKDNGNTSRTVSKSKETDSGSPEQGPV